MWEKTGVCSIQEVYVQKWMTGDLIKNICFRVLLSISFLCCLLTWLNWTGWSGCWVSLPSWREWNAEWLPAPPLSGPLLCTSPPLPPSVAAASHTRWPVYSPSPWRYSAVGEIPSEPATDKSRTTYGYSYSQELAVLIVHVKCQWLCSFTFSIYTYFFALILVLGVKARIGYPQLVPLLLQCGKLGSQWVKFLSQATELRCKQTDINKISNGK